MPNVLSTISGTLCSCATFVAPYHIRIYNHMYGLRTLAISLIGLTLYLGFPMLSTYTALVFSSIAAANAAGSSDVTNLTAIPYFLKSTTPAVSSRNHIRAKGFYP